MLSWNTKVNMSITGLLLGCNRRFSVFVKPASFPFLVHLLRISTCLLDSAFRLRTVETESELVMIVTCLYPASQTLCFQCGVKSIPNIGELRSHMCWVVWPNKIRTKVIKLFFIGSLEVLWLFLSGHWWMVWMEISISLWNAKPNPEGIHTCYCIPHVVSLGRLDNKKFSWRIKNKREWSKVLLVRFIIMWTLSSYWNTGVGVWIMNGWDEFDISVTFSLS